MTAIQPVSDARWLEAQRGEQTWWRGADRSSMIRKLAAWYTDLLAIDPTSVAGKTITDIGGGPMPLGVLFNLPYEWLIVVDPLALLFRPDPLPRVSRQAIAAEDYWGPQTHEVWGYNVLQHVLDPAAVLETAKRCAQDRIRWFDWVLTPVEQHHPHSIDPDWLVAQFAGWRIVSEARGRSAEHNQSYVALVAEKQ